MSVGYDRMSATTPMLRQAAWRYWRVATDTASPAMPAKSSSSATPFLRRTPSGPKRHPASSNSLPAAARSYGYACAGVTCAHVRGLIAVGDDIGAGRDLGHERRFVGGIRQRAPHAHVAHEWAPQVEAEIFEAGERR